ncbi:MAG: hypothetical protein JSS07_00930 [Proteobacteria bacterium]|nr:hypothetical protein [Pseudomonadota bacterium]
MPILSFEKLDAILQHYASEAPFVTPLKPEEKINRMKYFDNAHTYDHKQYYLNILGDEAMQFIAGAQERYHRGILAPPLTQSKIQCIYTFFDHLNKDLLGDKKGTLEEQMLAKTWDLYWQNFVKKAEKKGGYFSQHALNTKKAQVLTAYRDKVIDFCLFKPKGWQTHEVDEIRAQEFLAEINQYYSQYHPIQTYDILRTKFEQELSKYVCLDLQALSRYLNLGLHMEYINKFEEIIDSKPVEFIGFEAKALLYAQITKDKEFHEKLPVLLSKSDALKHFVISTQKEYLNSTYL